MIGKSPIYFGSWSISKTNHFMVAFVPTGIKIGVWTTLPFKFISQTLAFHLCLIILNFSLDIFNRKCFVKMKLIKISLMIFVLSTIYF